MPPKNGHREKLFTLATLIAFLVSASSAADLSFETADEAVTKFMDEHHIHAATLAISRNGQLLHERAFGFANHELTMPLTPQVRKAEEIGRAHV